MRNRRDNWTVVVGSGLDLVLLQEAQPPPGDLAGYVIHEPMTQGPHAWWTPASHGTAIWSRWPLTRVGGSWTHPGGAVAADVEAAGGTFRAASVYSRFHKIKWEHRASPEGYSTPTTLRLLADLIEVIDDPKRRKHVVLGGDFNSNPKWRLGGLGPAVAEALGLRSVLPIDAKHQIPTMKMSQIDYLFVGCAWKVEAADVERTGPMATHSDHQPVVAEMHLH